MKNSVRKEIKNKLKSLSNEYIDQSSRKLIKNVLTMNEYSQSESISVFLSMANEVNSSSIVENAFMNQKTVFIPKITGKQPENMFMLAVLGMEQLLSFPKNSWGIPEPSTEAVANSVDGGCSGLISLVLVPGVAFDASCGRLGHGKGYYGESFYHLPLCTVADTEQTIF